jgi:hypothetical protein
MEGTAAGAAGFVPGTIPAAATQGRVPAPPAPPGSGPNPTVAGILAGFFPFGVGPVYTGQYAKGLAHLAIFVLLIAGANASDSGHSEALGIICGFGIAFFYVYQIIDAVRTAKAIQMAQPIPDPFGLVATFGGGARIEASKIPMGAIVLILLGVLFLLHTMGVGLGLDRFWPLILIALGVWLCVRCCGLLASVSSSCQCARCRTRRIMGPAMLITIGVLFLLENLHALSFGRTWPVILLVIGAVKLLQGSASTEGHILTPGPGTTPPGGPIPPVPPEPPTPPVPPTSEVNRG